jgi:hypothetical protein
VEKNEMRSKILVMVVGALLVLAAPSVAQSKQPLPAFTVHGTEGAVPSTALAGAGRTLLIYLQPDCRPCDSLVQLLGEWQSAALVQRTVVLVAGDAAHAERVITALPQGVSNLRVYADPEGAAATALQVTGAPVLIGVEQGETDWTIAGVLANVSLLESIVRSWVEVPQ